MEKMDKIPENEIVNLDRIINNKEEASYSKALRILEKL
tara:strand:+ start:115 stop:228 length:114 start_codon:yes stop_codon:yes gene_type:complete